MVRDTLEKRREEIVTNPSNKQQHYQQVGLFTESSLIESDAPRKIAWGLSLANVRLRFV